MKKITKPKLSKQKKAQPQKVDFWKTELPWKEDRSSYYKYLILLQLIFIFALLGYLIYLYHGFSYLPRYFSEEPEEALEYIELRRELDTSQEIYDEDFEQATRKLELEFTYTDEIIQTYFVEYNKYPESLDDLVSEFIGADELNENFKYYTNGTLDEYELNVDLGPLAKDLMANDGGNDPDFYELGTDLELK